MMSSVEVLSQWREARQRVREMQAGGKRVGVVPTMGALHAGHLSLVEASAAACDATVVTIFVNPTQFGPSEDLDKYPRTLEVDLEHLAPLGVDFVFAPEVDDMYPAGATTAIQPPDVALPLEGEMRPGHFAGVCTIVFKLFQIIPADVAFFGQKDYQQCLVVQQMIADLNIPIEIQIQPIVREADGLAMSSRNRYLSADERSRALGLSQALNVAERMIREGERDPEAVMRQMRETLADRGVTEIDYAVVASPDTLQTPAQVSLPLSALIAAHVGKTRLIDNRLIN